MKKLIEKIEEIKKYTQGGTKQREMIYNKAIEDVIKIIKKYAYSHNESRG